MARRKLFFSESVIQSARANTDIKGLFYQNDIESLHAKQKRNQNFKTETVIAAISNIQNIIGNKMMKSDPSTVQGIMYFLQSTRNSRCLVTYGIRGVNKEKRSNH